MVACSLPSLLACLVRCLLPPVGAVLALMTPPATAGAPDLRRVEHALAGTGFGVESLLRRHARDGQGGPFIPAAPAGIAGGAARWDRLRRALAVLPLAAPLAEYAMTSGFGHRRDPINRRLALHAGIDLRAPLRSPVVATAPGRVVFAGRRGSYGRMVEIDHGLGVHTRYAHLAQLGVRVGQVVRKGMRIGLLGSSGRSTGPHLHYEVLVDGRARNPLPFLRAGVRLGQVRE